jgi:hypothetical protein
MQLKHDGHFKGQQIQTLLPPIASLSLHSSGTFYPWPCPLHKTTPSTDSLHQSLTCSFPTQQEHFFHAAFSSLTTLKVEAANSSKTSVANYRLTWHDIPEYFSHHEQQWESHVTQTCTSFKIWFSFLFAVYLFIYFAHCDKLFCHDDYPSCLLFIMPSITGTYQEMS